MWKTVKIVCNKLKEIVQQNIALIKFVDNFFRITKNC